MKIYTKKGDEGETSLLGGKRVAKDDARIEANGEIDMLSSLLGLVRSKLKTESEAATQLESLQRLLMQVMACIASSGQRQVDDIEAVTTHMEAAIDRWMEGKGFTGFILPGRSETEAVAHVARCQARKVERLLWSIRRQCPLDSSILRFFNRLSDYLFALAQRVE